MTGKPDLVDMEKEVLKFWEDSKAFLKLKEMTVGRPLFRFVDGPITANNPMGVHHAWGRTLKDVFIRYHVMNGFDCNHQNGFDCQGLWVEVGVEKALELEDKQAIEAYGLDKFATKCRERVEKYADVITEQSKRLGQWMHWENSYYTHSDENIQWIWKFLGKCNDNGWLQKRHRPMPWCNRCGTSLSDHEMAGSYEDKTHTSVYVTAELKSSVPTRAGEFSPGRYLLVWTTTPWTLPANVAIAVNPELTYIEVEVPDKAGTYILCKDAKKALAGTGAQVLREFPGSELVGEVFLPFFADLEVQNFEHRVVAWDEVKAGEGTGLVHIAPGCGKEDFELGERLGLPVLNPVDESGRYTEDFGWLSNYSVSDFNVWKPLAVSGKLFKTEDITHSYPVCWRCKEEVIFRLVDEWFIDVEEIRPQMIEAAKEIEWQPSYMSKTMEDWLNNMSGWCISRKRYWGLPLPFYDCECGHTTVVTSKDHLRALATNPDAVDELPELHRPWIDEVSISCPECSAEVSRVTEVGDCWLDAGIVPYSTDSKPVEWICEMKEQVRLWFYSMLFMGVTMDGESPYKKVTTHGKVVDEDGGMFSKTGYMIPFDEAAEKMGADTMRYLFCKQTITSDVRFGYQTAEEMQRKMQPLWNVFNFYQMYTAIDGEASGFYITYKDYTTLDYWLKARTQVMINNAHAAYQKQNTALVLKEVEDYLDDFTNWYIRLNRRRFWKSGMSAEKQAGYLTMWESMIYTLSVLAPILPFTTEWMWLRLKGSLLQESIHHGPMTEARPLKASELDILKEMAKTRELVSLGLKLRNEAKIQVKQPLSRMSISGTLPGADCCDYINQMI
jgi:isoleucyl-tRNA synthetase